MSTQTDVPVGYVKAKMSTDVDGNIFAILSKAVKAMKKAGHSDELQKQMVNAVKNTASYDEALQVLMKWIDFE